MLEELIGTIVVGAPNFAGLIIAVLIQYRLINRLMDKLDDCDCPSHTDNDDSMD